MGFLNKIYRINLILLLVFLIISCEKPKQEIINEASKQENAIELPTYQEISPKEIEKYDGIYNFGYNNNSFVEKFDETEKMQQFYLYNCGQIDSKSKTLIIQLTKNTDRFYFDIKKKDDTHWLFISKNGFIEGDLERSYGEHLEIGLSFTDTKGKMRNTSISAISDKSLEACIELNNENYDSEIQFVKEQNNAYD